MTFVNLALIPSVESFFSAVTFSVCCNKENVLIIFVAVYVYYVHKEYLWFSSLNIILKQL